MWSLERREKGSEPGKDDGDEKGETESNMHDHLQDSPHRDILGIFLLWQRERNCEAVKLQRRATNYPTRSLHRASEEDALVQCREQNVSVPFRHGFHRPTPHTAATDLC